MAWYQYILLCIIEILFFIGFTSFLYEIILVICEYFKIAYYISYKGIDILIIIINYLIAVLFIMIFKDYAMFGYFYIILTSIILVIFEL